MSSAADLEIIEDQPRVKIWGEELDDIRDIRSYKGKFVVTDDRKLFAKLYPKSEWQNAELFHDMVVRDLGVKNPESHDVKDVIVGGGKIEIQLYDDKALCKLYGKSTIYGDYEAETIDTDALALEIQDVFEIDDVPVEVIADHEE